MFSTLYVGASLANSKMSAGTVFLRGVSVASFAGKVPIRIMYFIQKIIL